jgi:3'-5' exoribonuclease
MSVAPTDLTRLAVGDRVSEILLVQEVEQRESVGGGFTRLTLANRHGRMVTAPCWASDAPRIAGAARGVVAQVVGEVGHYRGARQLKVMSFQTVPPESVDWRRLLPSVDDVAVYWGRLDRWRADIYAPRLRRTLALLFDDQEFRSRFEACPASLAGHHAQLGGLLRHTAEVAAIGRDIATAVGADPDLVLAGALLHDIGKLAAYRWTTSFEMTDLGGLVGHVALGLLALDRAIAAADAPPCTAGELGLLQHFIASHHGRLEHGATVAPMTLEAEILHFADDTSAKTASMADALADDGLFTPGVAVSSRTVWQLDRRRIYRASSDWGAQKTERPPSRG